MRLVKPYVDEQKQVIFIEFEEQWIQDIVNGALLALLVMGPISLLLPPLAALL